jgi:hypothetical protein
LNAREKWNELTPATLANVDSEKSWETCSSMYSATPLLPASKPASLALPGRKHAVVQAQQFMHQNDTQGFCISLVRSIWVFCLHL